MYKRTGRTVEQLASDANLVVLHITPLIQSECNPKSDTYFVHNITYPCLLFECAAVMLLAGQLLWSELVSLPSDSLDV